MALLGRGHFVPALICGLAMLGCGSQGRDEPVRSAVRSSDGLGSQAAVRRNSAREKRGCYHAVVRKVGAAGEVAIRVKCNAGTAGKRVEFAVGATDLRHQGGPHVLNFGKRLRPVGKRSAGSVACRRADNEGIFCRGRASGQVTFLENLRLDPADVCRTDFWVTVNATKPCHGICNADLTIRILSRGRPKGCG